jgi:hypothetical protein
MHFLIFTALISYINKIAPMQKHFKKFDYETYLQPKLKMLLSSVKQTNLNTPREIKTAGAMGLENTVNTMITNQRVYKYAL